MDKEEKEKVKTKLTVNTTFGLIYFVASIVMILVAFMCIYSIFRCQQYFMVWILAGYGLIYCVGLFVLELIRSRINKAKKKKQKEQERQDLKENSKK